MPIIPFVNVPFGLGVPAVLRDPANPILPIVTLLSDAQAIANLFKKPISVQWGIYRNGEAMVVADSVIGVEYKQDWDLANYPLEENSFETYDKINSPFSIRIRFTSGGTEVAREALLASVEAISSTLDLYDVVTPERTYSNLNVMHYDYSRTAVNGVGMITVDIGLQEIRSNAVADFSNTEEPSGQDPQNGGVVQAADTSIALPAFT